MWVNGSTSMVLLFFLLIIASYTDLKRREIPNIVCLLIVMISLFDFKMSHLLGICAALPFGIAAIFNPSSIGGGDIKITAAVGLVLGFWETLIGMTIGLLAVVLIHGVYMLFTKKKLLGEEPEGYPLAPFLTFGFMCIYFLGGG